MAGKPKPPYWNGTLPLGMFAALIFVIADPSAAMVMLPPPFVTVTLVAAVSVAFDSPPVEVFPISSCPFM
jgi:hypothetical protein